MSLAPYIATLGRGPGRSRALTQDEAEAAMGVILAGDAAPEAIGAMLMLLRFRGETAPEIAGFVSGLGQASAAWGDLRPALDWPSYAAGRSRGAPYFLLSAKLVAAAGYPVFLHGWNAHLSGLSSVRETAARLGIAEVATPEAARVALAETGLCYAPLQSLCPQLLDLMKLREVLGLRSCMNTVARMLNPARAAASVQGVFHPSYRDLQTDAALLLGRRDVTIIKGGGGEFERNPAKPVELFGLNAGVPIDQIASPTWSGATRRLHEPEAPLPDPVEIWSGAAQDAFASAIIIETAALALWAAGGAASLDDAGAQAELLWLGRHQSKAA